MFVFYNFITAAIFLAHGNVYVDIIKIKDVNLVAHLGFYMFAPAK